ncbi:hypothetical protein LXL04_011680 [Taraxacum kok-saghyz]
MTMNGHGRKQTILMFPWLGHGHISPFLELSKKLNTTNLFDIYLCSTPVNLTSIKTSPAIQLIELHLPPLPELPPHLHTTNGLPPHLMPVLKKAFDMASDGFSEILKTLKPDLLIYDIIQPWAPVAASALEIPSVVFITTSIAAMMVHFHLSNRPGIPLPFSTIFYRSYEYAKIVKNSDIKSKDEDFVMKCVDRSSSIVLVKSFKEIEGKYSDYLSVLTEKKIVPVGPLVADPSPEMKQNNVIQWLDTKATRSTVFVSFGSEYFLSDDDLEEIAYGLEMSNVNFIWVLRFPNVERKVTLTEALPFGFLERVKDRGLVIEGWAPQAKILGHKNIGGFVSHCGWSSVMEAMKYGVPMVAMPMHLDQPINARLVEEVGIGVEVVRDEDGRLRREKMAAVVQQVVLSKLGEVVREKAKKVSSALSVIGEEEIDAAAVELLQLCRGGGGGGRILEEKATLFFLVLACNHRDSQQCLRLSHLIEHKWFCCSRNQRNGGEEGHGHISPFLELAKKLTNTNLFDIYMCSTRANLNSIKTSPAINLIELPLPALPELPPQLHTTNGLPPHLMPTLKQAFDMASPQFSKILKKLQPDLLIYDLIQPWAPQAASALGIPSVVFITTSTTMAATMFHLYLNSSTGVPFPFSKIYYRSYELTHVSEILKSSANNRKDKDRVMECVNRSSGIVLVKSFKEIEGKYRDYLSLLTGKKIVPVGPLVVDPCPVADVKQNSVMEWLDTRAVGSTVFVSFGSEYFLSDDDLKEIAYGLKQSNVNFIWVLRFPNVERKQTLSEALPFGFLERVNDKGLVIEGWAPQAKILGHKSIGGFVSHCGWSSTMEAMKFGVPIIAMPMHLDQPVNARLVEEVGFGVEVVRDGNGRLCREMMAAVVQHVVVSKLGEVVRKKAKKISVDLRVKGEEEVDVAVMELLRVCRRGLRGGQKIEKTKSDSFAMASYGVVKGEV